MIWANELSDEQTERADDEREGADAWPESVDGHDDELRCECDGDSLAPRWPAVVIRLTLPRHPRVATSRDVGRTARFGGPCMVAGWRSVLSNG